MKEFFFFAMRGFSHNAVSGDLRVVVVAVVAVVHGQLPPCGVTRGYLCPAINQLPCA